RAGEASPGEGRGPFIHVFPLRVAAKTWMVGPSPTMTMKHEPCLNRFTYSSTGPKIHTRFSRWAKSGVWERMFQHLTTDADNEYAMIDSTIVRAHQHSAGAKKKTAR